MEAEVSKVAGLNFLLVEIDTGLTFARIAKAANAVEAGKFERNLKNARKAYDSAVRFRNRMVLEGEQKSIVDANLTHLKTVLQGLGEAL